MRRVLLAGLAALLVTGCAGSTAEGGAGVLPELASGVLALLLVLGLAWASLKLMRRMNVNLGATAGAPGLRFLRALPVGPRERIVLVAYEGEVLMVGVAAGQITLLDRRPDAAASDLNPRENPS